MPKSLADGRTKLVLLSAKPADPESPTVAELTAGEDISCAVLSSAYSFGAADSDKVAEKPLCVEGNVNAIGASNWVADVTLFRYFDEATSQTSIAEDAAYQALKEKGTVVWLAERESAKKSTEAFVAADETTVIEVLTDNPQKPSDQGGYLKRRIPLEPQAAWTGQVAAGV